MSLGELVDQIETACDGRINPVVVLDDRGVGAAVADELRDRGIRVARGSDAVVVKISRDQTASKVETEAL